MTTTCTLAPSTTTRSLSAWVRAAFGLLLAAVGPLATAQSLEGQWYMRGTYFEITGLYDLTFNQQRDTDIESGTIALTSQGGGVYRLDFASEIETDTEYITVTQDG